jgi:opacity protein-like surface antigen
MKTRLLLSAAALAAILSATGASAQGWYISVLGGPSWDPHVTQGASGGGFDTPGFNAGGRLGYSLDNLVPLSGFALETDIFYNQSHFGGTTSRESSLSYMGNLVYHVDTGWPIGIYGGAGAGAVRTGVDTPAFDADSTVFGWQAIGGIDYAFSPDQSLFAEYRYQNAHDANLPLPAGGFGRVGNTSNNLSVGLKFSL